MLIIYIEPWSNPHKVDYMAGGGGGRHMTLWEMTKWGVRGNWGEEINGKEKINKWGDVREGSSLFERSKSRSLLLCEGWLIKILL